MVQDTRSDYCNLTTGIKAHHVEFVINFTVDKIRAHRSYKIRSTILVHHKNTSFLVVFRSFLFQICDLTYRVASLQLHFLVTNDSFYKN